MLRWIYLAFEIAFSFTCQLPRLYQLRLQTLKLLSAKASKMKKNIEAQHVSIAKAIQKKPEFCCSCYCCRMTFEFVAVLLPQLLLPFVYITRRLQDVAQAELAVQRLHSFSKVAKFQVMAVLFFQNFLCCVVILPQSCLKSRSWSHRTAKRNNLSAVLQMQLLKRA